MGFQAAIGRDWSLSSDYVHTRGSDEPRFLNINPRIERVCNPAYPGSTPADPRCVRGVNTPLFRPRLRARRVWEPDRLEQINMFATTNESKFDSFATTLRGALGSQPAVLQLCARQFAVVGRPADRVVQRERHRDRAGEPVRRRRIRPDPARRTPPRRGAARCGRCPATSKWRRSSSGPARDRTR